MSLIVSSYQEMEATGAAFIKELHAPSIIYLRGDLGAGKTTFVRGALREMGYQGLVKSPTFTIVESYPIASFEVHHFDLYRVSDPEELDYIGVREFCSDSNICFIEWPDMGLPLLPKAHFEIKIEYIEAGRRVSIVENKS